MARLAGTHIVLVNWRDRWHPQAGGAETYAWEMATGLARRGADVMFVAARAPGQVRREAIGGVRIVRMGGRFTVYPLVLAWLLAHRRWADVVVDAQNGIPFFTPWVMPRRVPVFCLIHHVHDRQWGLHFGPWLAWIGRVLEGPVARRCYRRHACITVSHSSRVAISERLGWEIPTYVIPNGITIAGSAAGPAVVAGPAAGTVAALVAGPAAGPAARPAVVAGPAAAAPLRLVWVGRLVPHKRAGRVLDVAERLRGTGATIDVIGHGPESAPLAIEVARRGLGDVVRLRGFLAEADKAAVVAAALLHLSTSQGEGWGLSVLEAAALGVPTVAYDVDGLRDAVRDGSTGWLVRSGERIGDVVARAVKELADPARRAEMSRACRAWAAEFDWDRSAERLARLLSAAMCTTSAPACRGGGSVGGHDDGGVAYLDGDGADGSCPAGPDQLAG